MRYSFITLFFFLYASRAAPQDELVKTLPNLTEPLRSNHYTGYLKISDEKQLFYWYVESENDPSKDPLVLWLNGGPGCASMEGLFIEMGPFRVRNNGESVDRNPWTWNRIANIIYLDAPAGVGFSIYNNTDKDSKVYNDDEVANDNLKAIQLWFNKFPERKSNNFFVAGESYGGTYVPMLSSRIIKSRNDVFKNFQGMLIGNGCLDDEINFNTGILYQYYHGLIDETQFENFTEKCCQIGQQCNFYGISQQNSTCGNMANDLSDSVYYTGFDPYFIYFSCYLNPNLPYPPHEDDIQIRSNLMRNYGHIQTNKINPYRVPSVAIHGQPDCASHSDHIPYLNSPEVRKILKIPSYVQIYEMCNNNIAMNYNRTYNTMTNFFMDVLESKKRIALFNGDADTVCNVVQNAKFLKKLNRTLLNPSTTYNDEHQYPRAIGLVTEYDGVTLITIKEGGHFPAATEQKPKETFQVFQNYVNNQNYSTPVKYDQKYVGNGQEKVSGNYLIGIQILLLQLLGILSIF